MDVIDLNHNLALNHIICQISDLKLDSANIHVYGMIISKYERRVVVSAKCPLKPMNVCNLILRDSPNNFILVTCWGSKEFIDDLLDNIEMYTWVVIKNPLVKSKTNDHDDQFKPWTPSQYELSVTEKISQIDKSHKTDASQIEKLKSLLIREHNDFYTLCDILISEHTIVGKEVNLLFAIREIEEAHEIKTRTGKTVFKQDLIIFDQTNSSFKLTIWDRELIKMTSMWIKLKTVIFAVGIRITQNEYSKTLQASTTSKTIFIPNPNSKEGFELYSYAGSAKLPEIVPLLDQLKQDAFKCSLLELKHILSQGALIKEFVLVNAMISQFDIDVNPDKLFIFKCKRCEIIIDSVSKKCQNQNCKNGNFGYTKSFEHSISLSDHTSTLDNVRLSGYLFEKLIGTTIEEFLTLTDELKTKLKWKFLFERKLALIKITCKSSEDESFLKYYFKLIELEDFLIRS